MKKKTLLGTSLSFIVTLALMLAFGGMTVFADDEQPSGTCGPDLVWELDTSGTLTISGEGDMYDYDDPDDTPWNDYKGSITKVIIEDGVEYIGYYAFHGCGNLSEVEFSESVVYIGGESFSDCISISEITIPESVLEIGEQAFYNCENLESLNIQGGVKVIGYYAFDSCYALKKVVLPQCLTTIYDGAFDHCEIESIELPENLTYIGFGAFAHGRFKSIVIPGKVSYIGGYAFATSDLESVTIPESVKTIGMNAFLCCNRLTSIYCYADPSSIDAEAFDTDTGNIKLHVKKDYIQDYQRKFPGIKVDDVLDSGTCGPDLVWKLDTSGTLTISGVGDMEDYGLGETPWNDNNGDITKVVIENGVTGIGKYAFSQSAITSITIPGSVEVIDQYAFLNCNKLKTVVILNGVDGICEYAFKGCSCLATVTIPASVRYIYSDAFNGCTSVTDVYCDVNPVENSNVTFKWYDVNCDDFKPSRATLCHVKDEYLEVYKANYISGQAFDVNVTFVGSTVDMDLGDHLYGYRVSLDGDIAVNFCMTLSDELLASDTAKMVFAVTSLDGTNTRTIEIPVSSLVEGKTKTGNDCIFMCNVVAKEMTSTITAQMVDGDQKGKVYTYSVQKYAQYIIANPSKFHDGSVEIVKAMLNYGACAQTYFGYNTENLANSIMPADEQVIPDVSASMIEVDALYAKGSTVPSKVSLSLESTVTLKLSFETALLPEDVEFYDENGKVLKTEISGEYTVVLIKGIPVQDLDKPVKISVSDGSEIAYCPLRYCRAVLANTSNPAYTADLKKLVAALYLYNKTIIDVSMTGI